MKQTLSLPSPPSWSDALRHQLSHAENLGPAGADGTQSSNHSISSNDILLTFLLRRNDSVFCSAWLNLS